MNRTPHVEQSTTPQSGLGDFIWTVSATDAVKRWTRAKWATARRGKSAAAFDSEAIAWDFCARRALARADEAEAAAISARYRLRVCEARMAAAKAGAR